MKIVIIGNGSVGLAAASGILRKNPKAKISLIGQYDRPFSASMAAAAMLNSFAELEPNCLTENRDKIKFETSQKAARMWQGFMEENDIPSHLLRMGTVILNNTGSDKLDDENFYAIKGYLESYKEPFELIDPASVRGYQPADHVRAHRALFVPREGWLNPDGVILALAQSLEARGVLFINAKVASLEVTHNTTTKMTLSDGASLSADIVILANGSYASELYNTARGIAQPILQIVHGVGCTIGLYSESIECDYVMRTPNRGGACGIYHAPYNKNTFVCGASNLITTAPEKNARVTSIYNLTAGAMEQINSNHFKSQLIKVNLGYRPTSIDTYPVIGWLNSNTYVISGTKRDGYHFAPWLASACSEHILSKTTKEEFLTLCDPFRKPYTFGSVDDCAKKYAKHKLSAISQHGYSTGHTSTTSDLLSYYESTVRDFLVGSNIHNGVASEMVEAILGGYISPHHFDN